MTGYHFLTLFLIFWFVGAVGQAAGQTATVNGAVPAASTRSGGISTALPMTSTSPRAGGNGLVPAAPLPANIPPQFLNSTEAAIEQQSRGQFPTMDRSPSLPLGTLQRSWDKPIPASGQTAPGIIHYLWHPDFVMSVRTRDFMITTLLLPAWEKINEFYVGDPVVFEAKKVRQNVVAVRSRNSGADSNLTIIGATGNVYNFYLRSETWNSTQVSDMTVYIDAPRIVSEGGDGSSGAVDPGLAPDGAPPALAQMGFPDYLRRVVIRPENLRFDMKMYARHEADADIAPERVFEDGVFTYFDFGDRADSIARPVVHQLVDGVDTVVNTRTAGQHGNVLIAEAVGDFTLRNGNRVVCVHQITRPPPPAGVEIGEPPVKAGTAAEAGYGPRDPVYPTSGSGAPMGRSMAVTSQMRSGDNVP